MSVKTTFQKQTFQVIYRRRDGRHYSGTVLAANYDDARAYFAVLDDVEVVSVKQVGGGKNE